MHCGTIFTTLYLDILQGENLRYQKSDRWSRCTLQWELQNLQKHQPYILQQPFENLNGQAMALYTINDFNNSFFWKIVAVSALMSQGLQ